MFILRLFYSYQLNYHLHRTIFFLITVTGNTNPNETLFEALEQAN